MVRFTKMHGCENDYLVVDAIADPELAEAVTSPLLVRSMCDRHAGVGADGVLVLSRPESGGVDLHMRIVNADGSDGGMCGNGARCAAKLVVDLGYVEKNGEEPLTIETGTRRIEVRVTRGGDGRVSRARVDMGAPSFDPASLPLDVRRAERRGEGFAIEGRIWGVASMGNPHVVAFVDEPIDLIDLAREGPVVERHSAFPVRTNVHVVNVFASRHLVMRSWERGAGLTRACGSGACAAVAIGMELGVLDQSAAVAVSVPGGELVVRRDPSRGSMLLEGPAVRVFEGEWPGGSSC